MWVLLALSAVAAVVFAERTLYLHRGQIRSTAFLTGIKNILVKRRLMEAITVCEEKTATIGELNLAFGPIAPQPGADVKPANA